MNLFRLSLYFICAIIFLISVILVALSIKWKNRTFRIISIFILFSSFVLAGAGIGSEFIFNKYIKPNIEKKQTIQHEETATISDPSVDDLKCSYKILGSDNQYKKNAEVTIKNNTDSIFTGNIKLDFLDNDGSTVTSITLPVTNLIPNKSSKNNAIVDKSSSKIKYTFTGDFIDADENSLKNYYEISNISASDNYLRFDIVTSDTSDKNLNRISNEFKSKYNQTLCNSFILYFYKNADKSKNNLNNSIADFYCDNTSSKSLLSKYN
ncbi:hypothetical protein [Clostridium sp. BJN0001]|uniref:hypothetical protein n=1 Tax=Clostridium sp. BJN0001 TaxID=2930219 RepID=UPI001FD0F943|nr:hypothetical protein [Clostridium sp. BJN0001]